MYGFMVLIQYFKSYGVFGNYNSKVYLNTRAGLQ